LELEIGGIKTYVHAFVVQSVLYWLLLGKLQQKGMKLRKIEQADSSMEVEISDLGNKKRCVIVTTKERVADRSRNGMLVVRGKGGEGQVMRKGENSLTNLTLFFAYDSVV